LALRILTSAIGGMVDDRIIAGVRAHAAAKALVQGISWAGTILVLRRLDSEALGIFAVAVAVFNYASLIYEGSLLEALVQRAPRDAREHRAVYTLLLGSALLLGAVMVSLAVPVGLWVEEPNAAPLICVLASALLVSAQGILPQAELMRQMRFDRLAVIASAQALASTAVTIALAYLGGRQWALALGLIAGLATRTTLLNLSAPHLLRPTSDLGAAIRHLRFGGVLIADGVLWRWYTSLDTFLLGRWSGTGVLGYYSLGQHVANMPLEKISTIVNDVSLPAYAELVREGRGASRLLLETMRTHAAVGFPLFWGFASVAHLAVPALFGEKWRPAVFPLAAFALVAPLRLIGSVETPAMTGLGRPAVLLRTKLVIVPCMTAALVVGCWFGGMHGACVAWLTAFPVCYAIAFRYVLRAAGVQYGEVFRVIRGACLAAVLMMGAVQLTYLALSRTSISDWALLSCMVTAGVAAYVTLLRAIDPHAFALTAGRLRRVLALQSAR
jgi:O-antigen/teichoic acid export membrane protein